MTATLFPPVDGPGIERALRAAAAERILIIDGAMGTQIQSLKLSEADFRGQRFKGWNHDLKGNNDLLVLTQPDAIRDIHLRYFQRRRGHRRDQHLLLDQDRAGRLPHGAARL